MIDDLYLVFTAGNPEFKASFKDQFPDWIFRYYFLPVIDMSERVEIMLD